MHESRKAVPEPPTSRPGIWRRLAGSRGLQLLCLFVVLGVGLGRWLQSAGGARVVGEELGPLGIPVLVTGQALAAFVPLFGEMLGVANAALYGFWLGTAMNFAAWMATALVQYGIARRTARDFDFDASFARLPSWLRRLPVAHPMFLIGVRLALGGPIVNTAAGVFDVSLWRHTWCAAVGILPRAMLFASIGIGLLR